MSRLCVIWNTAEFGYVTLDDAPFYQIFVCPEKELYDVAELARGKARSASLT